METKQEAKAIKSKVTTVSTVPVRVKRETKKRLHAELTKINKKAFGRKVRLDALISRALGRLTEQDITELQDNSLSNADRLEMVYREHVRKNGPITKDDFIGIVLASTNVEKSNSRPSAENHEKDAK